MRNRSGIQGVASSPILVGAVTVLIVIVAVFLAYNANNGLPFVSTYNLKARVPNANALVKGNEVKLSGFGNFTIRGKASRPGRNPRTGESIPIKARNVVTFHSSHKLKAIVQGDIPPAEEFE